MPTIFQWLRTIRHFPPGALWHRLRLKLKRMSYCPPPQPFGLEDEGLQFWQHNASYRLPVSLAHWQFQHDAAYREQYLRQTQELLHHRRGMLLNEPFDLFQNETDLLENLPAHTPLWQENYGYLEFLLPVVFALNSDAEAFGMAQAIPTMIQCLEEQLQLFWGLPFKQRTWSAYGVSRRLLVLCSLIPLLSRFSDAFQSSFWHHFFQEAAYLHAFLEKDIRGNHLIKNYTALLAAVRILQRLPATEAWASARLKEIMSVLPSVFGEQLLPDGVHFERAPMYHRWVLQDLLECLSWLQANPANPSCLKQLTPIAANMLQTACQWRHCSGQIPLFGDSSLPQTPDLGLLHQYAEFVLSNEASLPGLEKAQDVPGFYHFPQAGFAVFQQASPKASLIVDCGDFGPHALPAHSHCDLGHFELHVDQTPIIVDSGVSDYTPSLLRDYFRGTAAHNTVWIPGEEQAELWGSFRVAEYPDFQHCEVAQDDSGSQVTIRYENYNRRYQHQRTIYSVSGHFWVVQDWLLHGPPEDRECYSLLHIHPGCHVRLDGTVFTINQQLLVLPFGVCSIEWADYAPWRNHLNLYSDGFNQARPGKVIAVTPKLPDCFGWVLVPFERSKQPVLESLGDGAQIDLPGVGMYRLTWDSSGLHVAFLAPETLHP
jgi:hypothetical protein